MTWNGDLRAALLVQRLVLSFVGIWPVKSRDYFMDLRWTIAALTQLIPMTVHFMELYLHCHGMKQSFSSLAPGCGAALGFTRLILPRVYRAELFKVITAVVEDWSSPKVGKEEQIMKKYLKSSLRVTTFTSCLVVILIGIYAFLAISAIAFHHTSSDYKPSLNDTFFEDNSENSCVFRSPFMRKLFTIVQAMQICFTSALTMGTLSLFFTLTIHLCGQFDILGNYFSEQSTGNARSLIIRVVRRHCHLIDLVRNLNDAFRTCLLVYLFVTALVLCIEGFLLISAAKDRLPVAIVHHTTISLLMLIQLSFYTFAGDFLQARSFNFSNAVYAYAWYELPASVTKDLHILLLRARIPHELTAGKIIPMNMITMKDVLKTTASYLSVLRVILDE